MGARRGGSRGRPGGARPSRAARVCALVRPARIRKRRTCTRRPRACRHPRRGSKGSPEPGRPGALTEALRHGAGAGGPAAAVRHGLAGRHRRAQPPGSPAAPAAAAVSREARSAAAGVPYPVLRPALGRVRPCGPSAAARRRPRASRGTPAGARLYAQGRAGAGPGLYRPCRLACPLRKAKGRPGAFRLVTPRLRGGGAQDVEARGGGMCRRRPQRTSASRPRDAARPCPAAQRRRTGTGARVWASDHGMASQADVTET